MTLRARKKRGCLLMMDRRPDFMVCLPIRSALKSNVSQASGPSINSRICRQVRCSEHFDAALRYALFV